EANFIFNLRGLSADVSADVVTLFEYISGIELSHEKTQSVKSSFLAELNAASSPAPNDIFLNDVLNVGYDREALIAELEKLTVSDLEWARDSVAETAYLRLFAVGNFERDEIQMLSDKLSAGITQDPLSVIEQHSTLNSTGVEQQNIRSHYI